VVSGWKMVGGKVPMLRLLEVLPTNADDDTLAS